MQDISATTQSVTQRRPLISRLMVVGGTLISLLVAGLVIWGIFWIATRHPETVEALRDVMIIALALASCLFAIALLLIAIMVIRLVNLLEFEIKPILEQTNETVGTLRGTTAFVSHNVVKPVARATGYVAGIRSALRVLFGDPRRNLPD